MIAFVLFDSIWLGWIMKDFNLRQLASIGRFKDGKFDILLSAALPVYVLLALAVVCFVLPKAATDNPILSVALWGALMGFIVYGVFDLTNISILKDYPPLFALADVSWGIFVFAGVSVLTWKVAP